MFFKSELLVAVEASMVTEKSVLEEQRISVQETLQQKIAEHSALQQEHSLVSLLNLRFTFDWMRRRHPFCFSKKLMLILRSY